MKQIEQSFGSEVEYSVKTWMPKILLMDLVDGFSLNFPILPQ